MALFSPTQTLSESAKTSESAGKSESTHERRSLRSLRIWGTLIGAWLTSGLLIPWDMHGEELSALALSRHFEAHEWFLLPLLGPVFLAAALLPKLTLRTRRLVLLGGGLLALIFGLSLFQSLAAQGEFSEIRHMTVVGVHYLLFTWTAVVTLDLAMHHAPRSRALAGLSLLSWLAYFGALVVPIAVQRGEARSVLGAFFERRSNSDDLLMLAIFGIIGLFGFVQAIRRAGKDRDKAAERFFRRSVIAYLLMPIPMLLLYGAMLTEVLDRGGDFGTMHNAFALVFGALFGGAFGVGHGLAGVSTLTRPARKPLALAASGVAILGLVVFAQPCAGGPAADDWMSELAEVTHAALVGHEVDPKYLGGYAEFDLRAAPTVAEPWARSEDSDAVLYALHVHAQRARTRQSGWLVQTDDALYWAGNGPGDNRREQPMATASQLERASPALRRLVEELLDRVESGTCLDALEPAQVQNLPQSARALAGYEAGERCADGPDQSRPATFATSDQVGGLVDRYLIVIQGESGAQQALEGPLYFGEGRLWIGAPSPSLRQ